MHGRGHTRGEEKGDQAATVYQVGEDRRRRGHDSDCGMLKCGETLNLASEKKEGIKITS